MICKDFFLSGESHQNIFLTWVSLLFHSTILTFIWGKKTINETKLKIIILKKDLEIFYAIFSIKLHLQKNNGNRFKFFLSLFSYIFFWFLISSHVLHAQTNSSPARFIEIARAYEIFYSCLFLALTNSFCFFCECRASAFLKLAMYETNKGKKIDGNYSKFYTFTKLLSEITIFGGSSWE